MAAESNGNGHKEKEVKEVEKEERLSESLSLISPKEEEIKEVKEVDEKEELVGIPSSVPPKEPEESSLSEIAKIDHDELWIYSKKCRLCNNRVYPEDWSVLAPCCRTLMHFGCLFPHGMLWVKAGKILYGGVMWWKETLCLDKVMYRKLDYLSGMH